MYVQSQLVSQEAARRIASMKLRIMHANSRTKQKQQIEKKYDEQLRSCVSGQEMHHFGPQISLRPVSAAIGGEYSPREGLASLSPRGMTPRGLFSAQSPRLMNLKNMSFVKQVAVDPHASTYAFWEKHVQLTNMRQSFAASRGFSRDGSATISRPASAQFGHLSPRMRTRKPGRVLDVPSGLPSGFGPLELWGTVPEGEFGQPLQHGSASPASPSTRKPPTTSAAPKLFALPQGISLEELQSAHDQIKEKLLSKYGSFTRAFRSIDQDGTGFIERHEFERALRTVNLDGIRQPVVLCLLEMMDYDDDDDGEAGYDIKYEEFVQFLAADDVRTLFPNSDKRDHKLGYKKAVKAVEKKAPVKRLYDPHVTAAELLQAHTMIKEQIQMKHGYFGKAFKYMDADRTGFVDRNEFKLAIKLMSLDTHIRPPVIDALFNLIERDGDHFKSGKGSDEIQCVCYMPHRHAQTQHAPLCHKTVLHAHAHRHMRRAACVSIRRSSSLTYGP